MTTNETAMGNEKWSVGVVGVGTMGSRIVSALTEAKFPVAAWDVLPTALDRAVELGATACRSTADLADRSAIVLMSLPGPAEVSETVDGNDGLLRREPQPNYIVDLSTVDPTTTRHLSSIAVRLGAGYLDAPVLGRPAACGKWTLPVGGTSEDLAAVREVLTCLAARIVLVGPSGSGNTLKLLNNLMFGAINAITCECMAGAQSAGLDPEVFFTTVLESNAATVSNLFREIGPKILEPDWSPTFRLSLLEKDNRLGLEMLTSAGLDPAVARAVEKFNRQGVDAGLGEDDTSGLVRLLLHTTPEVGELR